MRQAGHRSMELGGGLVVVALMLFAPLAQATNGMNAIASSSRSAGMGGADIAVAGDHSAMNTNPAGLTQYALQAGITTNLLVPALTLTDRVATRDGVFPLNDELQAEEATFPLMGAGLSSVLTDSLYGGLGFYVQGGMGASFEGMTNMVDDDPTTNLVGLPLESTYTSRSQVAFMKLTPALAYRFELEQVTLSVGAALNLGIAQMSFSHSGFQFPELDDDHVFENHTVSYQSNNAVGYAGRIGVLAELLDGAASAGITYQGETHLQFGGTTTVDQRLIYNNVEAKFGWPRELGAGLAVRPVSDLLLAVDVRWINWAHTMSVFTLENRANPGTVAEGYDEMNLPFVMNWRDQIVTAVGAEYAAREEITLRAGVNYGRNPVPREGINPLFPAISELHLTSGIGLYPAERLRLDVALEFVPPVTVRSDANNQLALEPTIDGDPAPNGYQVDVTMSQLAFHVSANYAF